MDVVDERQNKTDSYAVANHPPSTHLVAHRRSGNVRSRRSAATTIAAVAPHRLMTLTTIRASCVSFYMRSGSRQRSEERFAARQVD